MLPSALTRDPAFSGGNAVGLLINLGTYGQLFVLSLYFQQTRHMGPAGQFGLMAAGPHTPYPVIVVPLMAAGFGMAFTMPAATTTVVESAPAGRAGVASGAINASRQAGSTIGVALLGTLSVSAGLPAAMAGAGAAFACGAVIVALAIRTKPQLDQGLPV